ncbi:uncharacterized protein LOC101762587 [Setaria italica]|uniref:uncharacterized protein LOC101762587 n=1 Tax=Setaria italica TaxID=4555 RepID=UPI000350BFA3|nr:uncharacterized protein LOC101762587 [Setaria italica]XP_034571026.1 PE-PGRS family protein PE_PGRS16-like [Setaria viridis]
MEDEAAEALAGRGPPVAGRGGSGGGLEDAVGGVSGGTPSLFVWHGGLPTGPLGTLLVAGGVASGMGAGAWLGIPGAAGAATTGGADGATQTGHVAGSWVSAPATVGLATGAWPGGWLEWWVGAAAVALGLDWNRAGVSGVSTPTTYVTASQEVGGDEQGDEWLPVWANFGSDQGSSARRQGGRAPRPPPVAGTAPAPASVDVDLTNPRQ